MLKRYDNRNIDYFLTPVKWTSSRLNRRCPDEIHFVPVEQALHSTG